MQEKINKLIFILIPILIILLIVFVIIDNLKTKDKEYFFNMFYMDTYIYLKIYTDDNELALKVEKDINEIYKKYDVLANKYKSYEGVNNLFYITYNTSNEETLTLDKELYDLIKYGKEAYYKTNGLIDISIGNVLDIWKSYRDSKYGIPTIEELKKVDTNNIEDIILLENNQIKNNHVNIDLGAVAKGYVTKLIGDYLEKNGISKYIINAGGNVLVGDNYNNNKYSIGIEDPDNEANVIKVIYANNTSVVTSGGYKRFYEWNNKKYSHIIDPNTLYPTDYMKSVTIITEDSALADILSTYLFLMDIDTGKKYIESLYNVEAIWYTNDNKIITSSGIEKYE